MESGNLCILGEHFKAEANPQPCFLGETGFLYVTKPAKDFLKEPQNLSTSDQEMLGFQPPTLAGFLRILEARSSRSRCCSKHFLLGLAPWLVQAKNNVSYCFVFRLVLIYLFFVFGQVLPISQAGFELTM